MIKTVSHATFGCPDLEAATRFMVDFGLVVSHSAEGATYFRGAEGRPYIFVLKEAPQPGLVSVAYEVRSMDDLRAMAGKLGATVEPIDDNPWGGSSAKLVDCDGNPVEIVCGIQSVAPLKMPREAVVPNSGGQIRRKGRLPVFGDGPLPVLKLCHVVHASPDTQRFVDWYVEHLGAYPSDIVMGPRQPTLAFMRFPDGSNFVDHHNVGVFDGKKVGVQHVCFESLDMDAVFMAHRYLVKRGYRRSWGPVRHTYGGALSDYWHTSWGLRVEHVTDSDVLNDEYETLTLPMNELATLQWTTEKMPDHYME